MINEKMLEWQIQELVNTGAIEDSLDELEIECQIRDLAAMSEPELFYKVRELMTNIEIMTAAMRVAGVVPLGWTGPIGGHW